MKKRLFKIIILLIILLENFTISVKAISDTAKSTIAIDIETGRVLYEQNSHTKRLIASTTKIMTAIVAIENNDLDKTVEIGPEILTMYGTNIYIELGEKMQVKDLLYGLILRSGNDAAMALAITTSGSEEEFVKLMNQKAKEIGMNDTTFSNPHGLDDDTKNYSTAYDMALLSQYAYQNKTYQEISSTKKYVTTSQNKTYLWYNRSKLLKEYKYCISGKNGYTPDAGKTFVSVAKKDNLTLSIVTLKDPDIYNNHKRLYEKLFDSYKSVTIINKDIYNKNSKNIKKKRYIKTSFTYPLTKAETKSIKTTEITYENIENNSSKIGEIQIFLNTEKIGAIPVYTKTEKKENKSNSLFTKIKQLFSR